MSHKIAGLVRQSKQTARMQKTTGIPVLIGASGSRANLERIMLGAGNYNEEWLQELIFAHPQLVPIAQIEPAFGIPIPVAREVPCGHGFIDNLYLTPNGEIILVETKLWRNVQARREVVAQALDYVSALMGMGYEAFEAAVNKGAGAKAKRLYEIIAEASDALDEASFTDAVSRNLKRGRMLVIALGDGIRQEAEALAGLLQSHAGAHFTFALVELATWRDAQSGDMLLVPNTLAQTIMIERGILIFGDGGPHIKAVEVEQAKRAHSISEEMFFEGLATREPGLPAAVRAFLRLVEPLGVYPDLKASLNLKIDLPDAPRATNVGYIAKNGQLWTSPLSWTATREQALRYNQALADLIGGEVSLGNEIYLTANGSSAPPVSALLPAHAQGWVRAIRCLIEDVHADARAAAE